MRVVANCDRHVFEKGVCKRCAAPQAAKHEIHRWVVGEDERFQFCATSRLHGPALHRPERQRGSGARTGYEAQVQGLGGVGDGGAGSLPRLRPDQACRARAAEGGLPVRETVIADADWVTVVRVYEKADWERAKPATVSPLWSITCLALLAGALLMAAFVCIGAAEVVTWLL